MPDPQYAYDERIALVPLADAHAALLARWSNDPAVHHYLGLSGAHGEAEQLARIQHLRGSADEKTLGILLREGERLIGTVSLNRLDHLNQHAEYGIRIGEPDCWDKGYGFEAGRLLLDWGFNRLNLFSIYLRVRASNPRGIASYRKLGFRDAGALRGHVWRDGQYIDMLQFDLLREEFNALWADWRAAQRERYGIR